MRIILLTGDSLRHQYIAHSLCREAELTLIISEKKSSSITDLSGLSKDDKFLMKEHFRTRSETEKHFFKDYSGFPEGIPVLPLNHGGVNASEIIELLVRSSPDLIVLFGTSILKTDMLEQFQNKIINLHLGLSPYYRGSATNLFPFYFQEPECVGATIHLATQQVDKGEILHQLRPQVNMEDDLHQIGNQVIKESGVILPQVLQRYYQGLLSPRQQNGEGKLVRNRDITPSVIRTIQSHFQNGMIPDYLQDKVGRDSQRPIIAGF